MIDGATEETVTGAVPALQDTGVPDHLAVTAR